jgi:hypothetical protein
LQNITQQTVFSVQVHIGALKIVRHVISCFRGAYQMSNKIQNMTQEIQDRISELAYLMWESAGRQQGMAMNYWLTAEKDILNTMQVAAETVMPAEQKAPKASKAAPAKPAKPQAAPAPAKAKAEAAPAKPAKPEAVPVPAAATAKPAAAKPAAAKPAGKPTTKPAARRTTTRKKTSP